MPREQSERFYEFVLEREAIRRKKEAGLPRPWTEDKVLDTYRFCNVRRIDDRVSRWLVNEYYPHINGDYWFAAAIARFFNWPPSLKVLLEAGAIPSQAGRFRPQKFIKVLAPMAERREKIFTGAYVIGGNSRYPGLPKVEFIARHVLMSFVQAAPDIREAVRSNSVQRVSETIRDSCYAVKEFLAGQITADLTYLSHCLSDASDLYTWAPRGPGSQRGLNRVLGDDLGKKYTSTFFCAELYGLHSGIQRRQVDLWNMTLHDVQNCLCEFDKYMRTIEEQGRPRSLYRPETAF